MNKHLTDKDGEVRELTAADLAKFRPAKEALSPAVYAMLTARASRAAPTLSKR